MLAALARGRARAVRPPRSPPGRRCSTSATTSRASSTRTSTRRSRALEAEDRRGRHGQPVARRLEQAGARGDRRPRGRRRDDEPGRATSTRSRARKLIPEDWAKRLPNNCGADDLDHGDPGAQGQPEGHPRLGRPGQARRRASSSRTRRSPATAATPTSPPGARRSRPAARRRRRSELVQKIFANVPVLDGGGRAATTTFAQRNIGDALCTFESEVHLIKARVRRRLRGRLPEVDASWPRTRSRVVDKVVDKKGTRKQAEAYLKYLWSDEAQEIAAKHQLRPRSPALLAKYAQGLPEAADLHGRRALRRLDEGAEGALRRRRRSTTRSSPPKK